MLPQKIKTFLETNLLTVRKLFNDHNHLEEARSRFLQALPFLTAAVLTAIATTLYAKAFQFAENQSILLFQSIGIWSLILTPILFAFSWALVEYLSPYSNGSGIPQLMAAAEISNLNSRSPFISKLLGARIIAIKILSSLLGVLGGGAIGREGPTLQISGSIFHLVGKILDKGKHSQNHHILILSGGAAGLASAFNTPLGGIAYAMEELSKSHLSSFRTGVLQAVIVSGFFAQLILGPYLYLGYPKVGALALHDVGYLILTAVFASLVVSMFTQVSKLIVIYRSQIESKKTKLIVALFCGFTVAALALFLSPSTLGSGKEILSELLFNGKNSDFTEMLSRFIGPAFTYAAGGAGGIFAPTLALGASASSFIQSVFENQLGTLGVLAGMTAGLSALTQSPVTSFVLILEMTDRHSAIFPLMLAALVGQGVSKLISKVSFYEFVCLRILSTHRSSQDSTHEN
jgi:H+/Cl- antiporter ClcA